MELNFMRLGSYSCPQIFDQEHFIMDKNSSLLCAIDFYILVRLERLARVKHSSLLCYVFYVLRFPSYRAYIYIFKL